MVLVRILFPQWQRAALLPSSSKAVTMMIIIIFAVLQLLFSSFSSSMSSSKAAVAAVEAFTHEGWRIAMNIGREDDDPQRRCNMPNEWASSGCRLPVIVRCDFRSSRGGNNIVEPLEPKEVRFTTSEGEIVQPVEGGSWTLSKNGRVAFTFSFPNELRRNDVDGIVGTVRLEGKLYDVDTIKRLNEEYYGAREKKWDAGERMNDVVKRETAPLKWDEQTQSWVKRYDDEPWLSTIEKRLNLFQAERKAQRSNDERPNPKHLSLDCGPFPFPIIDDNNKYSNSNDDNNDEQLRDVYFDNKSGKVFLQQRGGTGILSFKRKESLIGTWTAEPINDKPLSYY